MTTSSDNRSQPSPRPPTAHWDALTQRLPEELNELDAWFDRQLVVLEKRHADFITRRSLKHSFQR